VLQHRFGHSCLVAAIRVDGGREHPGRRLAVAVEGGMHEGPEEVAQIVDPRSRPGAVPVDDRDGDQVAKDEVGLGQIPVSGHLRPGGERRALRQVVHVAHELRPRPYRVLGQREPVVRRSEPLDEGQDLAVFSIDAEESRSSLEAAVLEVKQKAVDVVGVRAQRPANRVTDPDDAGRRHSAGKRHFVVRSHREPA